MRRARRILHAAAIATAAAIPNINPPPRWTTLGKAYLRAETVGNSLPRECEFERRHAGGLRYIGEE